MDVATAVNEEARDLQAAGPDVIQPNEPWPRNDPEGAKRCAVRTIKPTAIRSPAPCRRRGTRRGSSEIKG